MQETLNRTGKKWSRPNETQLLHGRKVASFVRESDSLQAVVRWRNKLGQKAV
jgi:hypothetical protein